MKRFRVVIEAEVLEHLIHFVLYGTSPDSFSVCICCCVISDCSFPFLDVSFMFDICVYII